VPYHRRMTEKTPRRALLVAGAFVPILVAAALWLPRWWENREYRQAEAIAGIAARIVPGTLVASRPKVEPGMTTSTMVERIGKPSISVATEGKDSRREIWTYYFADGTLTVNVTDGLVQRVSAIFVPPKIPTSARPE
jgi:hypothetical protein